MHVFFAGDIKADAGELDPQESAHAVRVLRLHQGDDIILLDGMGGVYEAVLETATAARCSYTIVRKEIHPARKAPLHIAIAPTKNNDRTEWFLEKAVELGIEQITPVICDRSERRTVNKERFEKVLMAALKQSRQPWKPVLNSQVALKNFLETTSPGFIAHCNEQKTLPFQEQLQQTGQVTMLIGPEGDFTPAEVELAIIKGWKAVSLGISRLRTETAGVHVCSIVRLYNESGNK